MSEVPETTWAYFAALLDGEGYLYPFMHRNPYFIRTTKKGYGREFRCLIYNGSKDLLETVRKNIGMGHIVTHKKESKKEKNRIDTYSLRFYQGNLRIILPKIIPYLILKKRQAEIMLEMLDIVKNVRNQQLRETKLLLLHKQFKEVARKTAGNKYRKRTKQDAIIDKMIGQDGKVKLDSYA
jgi:hypothetical protein